METLVLRSIFAPAQPVVEAAAPTVEAVAETVREFTREERLTLVLDVIKNVATNHSIFSVSDVYEALDGAVDTTLLSPAMRRAERLGYIHATDFMAPCRIKSARGRQIRVWASKLYVSV